jgi:osmoprotectant transport system ATP-binding protein
VIRFEAVSKSFDGGASFALREVSLEIAAGAFVAVVGGSGSGKTTLLKTVNRLAAPTAGRVLLDGAPVDAGPAPALRRRIGYAFQGVGLFPHLSVAENIAITPDLLGWDREAKRARVAELLDLVRLPQAFADRAPDALSGGQRQRVGLARALAAAPKVMLLDEPFGALDPVTREALGEDYRALHERLGLTTLMITHDVQEAVILADRIVVMHEGRLIAQGAPATLSASPDARVAALMASPRRAAAKVSARLAGEGPA